MHEYSITERLFQLALEQADLEEGEQIQRLHIELDPNSGYAPDAIRFYFEHLAEGSAASGAELVFQVAPAAPDAPLQQIRLLSLDIESQTNEMPTTSGTAASQENEKGPHQSTLPAADRSARWAITIEGEVQDEKFQQLVCQLASQHSISGWIASTALGTQIEIEGSIRELEHFCHHLQHDAIGPASNIELKIGTAELKPDFMVGSRVFF